ncbi:MAG: zinc ABC transporter substrate-binding protein [Spirochaetaceae bacterium]|nr:zinc ABC transporter substrate-binding protein [Spirochaetaceae bacterium]
MKKVLLMLVTVFGFYFAGFAFGQQERIKDKVVVATAFHAVDELVLIVAGEYADVVALVPDTADVHHYEPRPKDIQNLNGADVVFVVGLGMEEWIEDLVEGKLLDKNKIVTLSSGMSLIEVDDDHDGHAHDHSHGGHSDDEDYDPHIWLGATEVVQMVEKIAESLSRLDPAHEHVYRENAKRFSRELVVLRDEFRARFATCRKKNLVVAHEAFGYLCRDFGLMQKGVTNVFNESESSAKSIAHLVDFCRSTGITVIFTEAMSSSAIAETVARELKIKTERLYTMESSEDGLSFLERYRRNLERIFASLQ